MVPDTGERYLSTPLFDGVSADMSDDEHAISRSTPSCRFDVAAPAPAPAPEAAPAVAASAEVADFVAHVLADREQAVVLFALEWCEFCWALRKLFAKAAIPYRSIDLDSTAYQRGNRGGQIRTVLAERSGSKTIPQVFVGGEFIGGCTETFEAFKAGSLQRLLDTHRVTFDASASVDPYALLPTWLHPR
jgi:cysteine synthase A